MKLIIWPDTLCTRLRELFRYDADAGVITRITPPDKGPKMMGPLGTMTPSGDLVVNITHEGRQWIIRLHKLAMFLQTGNQYKSVSFADEVKTNLVFDNLIAIGLPLTEENIKQEGTIHLRESAHAIYKEQRQVREEIHASWRAEREFEKTAKLEERKARKIEKALPKGHDAEYDKKYPKGGPTQADYDSWDKEEKELKAKWYATPARQAIVARAQELQRVFDAVKHRQGLQAGVDSFSFDKFMKDSEKHSRFKTFKDIPREFMGEFDYEACGIDKWEYDRITGLKILSVNKESQIAVELLLNYMVEKPVTKNSWSYVSECPEAGRMLSQLFNEYTEYSNQYYAANPNGANAPTSEPSVEPQTNPAQPIADQPVIES